MKSKKHPKLKDGDKFTIEGLRIFKNGKIVTKCKKGLETTFIARHILTSN